MKGTAVYSSPVGALRLEYEDGAVTALHRGGGEETPVSDPLVSQVFRQLDEYFAGTRRSFDFPCRLRGTPFQQKVWAALRDIPYGETRTYGQIAAAVGSPRACRAVGMANNRNPVVIAVPCHRVIGADGSLVGYGGGLDMKEALLALESAALRREKEVDSPPVGDYNRLPHRKEPS